MMMPKMEKVTLLISVVSLLLHLHAVYAWLQQSAVPCPRQAFTPQKSLSIRFSNGRDHDNNNHDDDESKQRYDNSSSPMADESDLTDRFKYKVGFSTILLQFADVTSVECSVISWRLIQQRFNTQWIFVLSYTYYIFFLLSG